MKSVSGASEPLEGVLSRDLSSRESNSLWADSIRRFKKNKAALCSLLFIVIVVIISLFAEELSRYPFDEQFNDKILVAPSPEHWLGTDDLGRDLYSRVIYGGRMSMAVGVITALISLIIGTAYGAVSGWLGGRVDALMMRSIEIFDSIPTIVLLILVKIFFDEFNLVKNPELRAMAGMLMALSFIGWMSLARQVRGQVLQVKEMLFIEAARATGASAFAILFRHILPNILGTIVVILTLQIPQNILFESFLSFIGLGLQPPFSSWGVLANSGWRSMDSYPHLILYPSLMLSLTMLAFQLFGDGLRDAIDPKM
jgi:oligopeptide transport system permease protein